MDVDIWQLLIQFAFRITFGVSLAMSLTESKWVTSGFYRVHLWVLMGVNTFAALAVWGRREQLAESLAYVSLILVAAIALAGVSYIGSVIWLYEKSAMGKVCLNLLGVSGLVAALLATVWKPGTTGLGIGLAVADLASSGFLLGATLSAMFLGHWYLNTPTMELLPLRRLVLLIGAAILVRTLVSGLGLGLQSQTDDRLPTAFWIFVILRWLSGILGALMLALMTWYTLKIPNTQSATGILYAGVILTFIGELTAQLLSVGTLYPL